MVTHVLPGEPGEEQFAVGDAVLEIGGEPAGEPAALQELWSGLATGAELQLTTKRDGAFAMFSSTS